MAQDLLNSYFTNSFQFTMNKDKLVFSNLLLITIGVPRGNVLGSFLFSVCINDLPNSFNFDKNLYADDSVIICNNKNIQNLKTTKEKEFLKVQS